MAIHENGYLRGQIGNLVNRKVGNQNIVQTKPAGRIRQTQWTKASAEDFGRASKAAALVRRAFITAHERLHDENMHNRLIRQMQRVMRGAPNQLLGEMAVNKGNIERLVDFQFNDKCNLQDYVYFDPAVSIDLDRRLCIQFPSFDPQRSLKIPVRSSLVVLKVDVAAFNFANQRFVLLGTQEIETVLYQPNNVVGEQCMVFDCSLEDMDTVLVTLSVLYLTVDGRRTYQHNHKELHPVGIVGAFRC